MSKSKGILISPITALILLAVPYYSNGEGPVDYVNLYFTTAGNKTIDYRYLEADDFINVPDLVKNDNITEVCVKGTWLFYDAPFYLNSDPMSLEGVTITNTDDMECFPAEEIFEETAIGSVQHVSSFHRSRANSIVFFQYDNFLGNKMVVNKAIKAPDEPPNFGSFIKSLITMGPKPWEVVMGDPPVRLCFMPPTDQEFPVCLISTLIDEDNGFLEDGGVLLVSQVEEDECSEEDYTYVIPMRSCYRSSEGVSHPYPNTPDAGNNTDECRAAHEILDEELIELVASRLNGSLGSGEWFSAIKDTSQIWKTELFDKCFQVLSSICPETVISSEYLMMFGSLFWHHMNKVWEAGKFLNETISELEWMEIMHDMNLCVDAVMDDDYSVIATETADALNNYGSLDEISVGIEKTLGYRSEYDHVMEINWLMANLVAATCTKARGYDTNFLPRFLNIFHALYLTPIESQWTIPRKYQRIYKYLFGGFGMHKSLTKIALCTQHAMEFSGLTEPYKRPMDQADKILLPKVPETKR